MDINFAQEEYLDGCYSGIIVFIEHTDDGVHECVSFVYDVGIGTVNLVRRLYPHFTAPQITEWSDFLNGNVEYIQHLIRERCMYKYR